MNDDMVEEVRHVEDVYSDTPTPSADELQERVAELNQRLQGRAQELWEDTTGLIRENPGTAVGIALVAGIALGTVLAGSMGGSSSTEKEEGLPEAVRNPRATTAKAKESLQETLGTIRGLLDDVLHKLK